MVASRLTALGALAALTAACSPRGGPTPVDAPPVASVASVTPTPTAEGGAPPPPDAPTPKAPPSAGRDTGHARRAEACLRDVECSPAETERRFVEAYEAGDALFWCFAFLDGTGVPQDLARGRACLEREVIDGEACAGGSAMLSRVELAVMMIDGVAGRKDIPGARALMSDCFDDVAKDAVLKHAAKKEADPKTPPLDFCEAEGGTTLTAEECHARRVHVAAARERLRAKELLAKLDARGKKLLVAAEKAFDEYATAQGQWVATSFQGGSLRGIAASTAEEHLRKVRADELAAFDAFVAPAAAAADAERSRKALAAGGPKAKAMPANERAVFASAESRWAAYRRASVDLYVHVFGGAQGEARVRDAVTGRYADQRLAAYEATRFGH